MINSATLRLLDLRFVVTWRLWVFALFGMFYYTKGSDCHI
jgi:hypothetical protein